MMEKSLAGRMIPTDEMIHYLNPTPDKFFPDTHQGTAEEVVYVGVSDISIEVHFKDGSGLRVRARDYSPLKVTSMTVRT